MFVQAIRTFVLNSSPEVETEVARDRKIEIDDILDAAERVVAREGAAALSIDAVAKEAGVSKSMVVYDHKTKGGLLETLIDRRVRAIKQECAAAVTASRDTPHPELFGRIAALTEARRQSDRAVMMAVSAAMLSDERLQKQIRDWISEDIEAIEHGRDRPRAALMAYFAATGFSYIDQFDYHKWDEAERSAIVKDILRVFQSFPDPN